VVAAITQQITSPERRDRPKKLHTLEGPNVRRSLAAPDNHSNEGIRPPQHISSPEEQFVADMEDYTVIRKSLLNSYRGPMRRWKVVDMTRRDNFVQYP